MSTLVERLAMRLNHGHWGADREDDLFAEEQARWWLNAITDELLPRAQWMPIETAAMKAESPLLLTDDGVVYIGFRDGNDPQRWVLGTGLRVYPTHWMPLPAPPSNSGGEG
jgi:hypothetical protein